MLIIRIQGDAHLSETYALPTIAFECIKSSRTFIIGAAWLKFYGAIIFRLKE